MRKRRMSIKEIIVVLLLLVVGGCYLLYMIFQDTGGVGHPTTLDMSNLKNLVGLYMSGQYDSKPSPKSTGHKFWLALFVGDPADIEDGVTIDDIYATPSMAGNLISPADEERSLSRKKMIREFEDIYNQGVQGWDKLSNPDNMYTSYAGPKNLKVFTDKSNPIVGCTGSRNGMGFYSDGFVSVNTSQGAEFRLYEVLAERFPNDWTGDETEPNWNSTLLKNVINIEPGK